LGRATHLAGRVSLGLGIRQRHWDLAGRQVSAPIAVIALSCAGDVNSLGFGFFSPLGCWLLCAERKRVNDRREDGPARIGNSAIESRPIDLSCQRTRQKSEASLRQVNIMPQLHMPFQ